MAHHNSTPASVLNAPVLVPDPLVVYDRPNRAERRHVRTSTGKRLFVPKEWQEPASNIPYVLDGDR